MPEKVYIDPKAVLGALAPVPKKQAAIAVEVIEDLGPTGPHEQDPVEAPPLAWVPPWNPWKPTPHYTETLDELWPEFDDLEERTAARLDSLLDEVAVEAGRIHKLKQRIWEDLPAYKIDDAERARFDKEFLAYLKRLNEYKKALDALPPSSTDTHGVHVGLVKRAEGAGPVPDAIMHLYFAQQLGILEEHAHDMSEGYVGRVMRALEVTDDAIEDAADKVEDAVEDQAEEIRDAVDDASQSVRDTLRSAWLWVGGIVFGTVVVGGAVTAAVLNAGRDE